MSSIQPLYASAELMARTTTYFAAHSDAKLDAVCAALQSHYSLPAFVDDWHDTWQYAFAKSPAIGVNVTKSEGTHTIETWMDGCPSGVNFQIIADFEVEPDDLVTMLDSALGATPVRYSTQTA